MTSLAEHEPAKEQYHEEDQEGDHKDDYKANEDKDAHDNTKKFEGSSQSMPSKESVENLPLSSPLKPSMSTWSKHVSNGASPKDRQSRRHKPRVKDCVMTGSFLEDKIVGILSKTLPNMLSNLFQEAMHQAIAQTFQQAHQRTPSMEVAIAFTKSKILLV